MQVRHVPQRIVVDTNVLLGALLSNGVNRMVFEHVLSECELYYIEPMREEFRRMLTAPNIRRQVAPGAADALVDAIDRYGICLPTPTVIPEVCEDPDDDIFFACAEASQATFLISDDGKVLAVRQHQGTVIIRPINFAYRFLSSIRQR